MDEQKKNNEIEEAASALIANAEEEKPVYKSINKQKTTASDEENEKKIFKKYKIKDIVFLAIITACTLVTGAVMPLLVNVPLFGIVQLGLGLQFSIFPVIGMMKVRKPGALLFQSIFISVFLIFMFPPMALIIVCALVAETLTLILRLAVQREILTVRSSVKSAENSRMPSKRQRNLSGGGRCYRQVGSL